MSETGESEGKRAKVATAPLASPRFAPGSLRFIKRLIGDLFDIGQRAPHFVKALFESPDLAAQTVNLVFKIVIVPHTAMVAGSLRRLPVGRDRP